jgi:hypothetical protein
VATLVPNRIGTGSERNPPAMLGSDAPNQQPVVDPAIQAVALCHDAEFSPSGSWVCSIHPGVFRDAGCHGTVRGVEDSWGSGKWPRAGRAVTIGEVQ